MRLADAPIRRFPLCVSYVIFLWHKLANKLVSGFSKSPHLIRDNIETPQGTRDCHLLVLRVPQDDVLSNPHN